MFKNYLTTAWRHLIKHKTFSFINIFGLALSLTAVWLIALFVTDELSFDRYHKNAGRIYRLVTHGRWGTEKFDITGTSGLAAPAFKNDFPEVENTLRIYPEGGGVIQFDNKRIKDDAIIFSDSSFFNILTYHFLAGDATALQKPNAIVLTKTLAAKLFSNPLSALNKVVKIDNNLALVTGIIEDVPHNSHFTFNAVRSFSPDYSDEWASLSIYTYMLLKKNANINQLRAKLPLFVKKYMAANWPTTKLTLELQPLTAIHLHSHLSYELGQNRDIKYIYVLSVVGLLILLIAFINYINITTARASTRLREVAVRKITGSGSTSLAGLFLTESVITICCAAAISMVLVTLAMPLFNYVAGKELSIWQAGIARTLLLMLAFSFVTGLFGGWYPAFFLSKFKTIPALKNQLGDVKGQTLFRKSLVLFQFAVTVVMITGSLVIYLQLNYVLTTNLGFNKKQVLTFHLDSRELRKNVPALRTALLQNPMVQAVASAGNPIGNNDIGMMDYYIEKNGAPDDHSNLAYGLLIDPDFIPAMQIKLIEGRNFSAAIPSDTNQVIVNEAFIKKAGWTSGMNKRMWGRKDSTGNNHFANIIGVVKDFHIYSLQHKVEPMILQLPKKANDRDNIYVRLQSQNLPQALRYVEQTFRQFDASSPFEYHFLDQNFAAQYRGEQKQGQLLLAFTILTIVIACLGLFGLITFTVEKRVKEIGIRKVLGAGVGSMVTLLTTSLLKVVLLSLLVAVPLSWLVMNKWLQDFAYRIQLQWWMFTLAGVISILIALITLSFQAIKAALANPVKSLRSE